jgi:hypothetical protein
MKISFVSILFLLSLLAMAISCKKDRDLHPKGWVADPTNLPQPPKGCKIVQEIQKGIMLPGDNFPDPETITLDNGRQIRVGRIYTTTYKYDQKGRIVEKHQDLLSGDYYHYQYKYEIAKLIRLEQYYRADESKQYMLKVDTIRLNDEGLAPPWKKYATLQDTDTVRAGTNIWGAVVSYYKQGNPVSIVYEIPPLAGHAYVYHYSYITRPALPIIETFFDQKVRNLVLQQTQSVKGSPDFVDGPVYQINFRYYYDNQGRVRRRIKQGVALNAQWLFTEDAYGIGVTDYVYECS